MKLLLRITVAGLIALGTIAAAQEATDPQVKARQALMSTIGKNTKVLGDMAGGKAPFDAAAAGMAKAALIEASARIPALFEPQATDPESEAKPEVWTNWDDYVTKAKALNTAVTNVDASSVETIGAGMGAIGGSCKDCHSTYRM